MLSSAWERFWFAPSSQLRLDAFRLVVLATAVYATFQFRPGIYPQEHALAGGYLDRGFRPIYAFELLDLPPLAPADAPLVLRVLVGALLAGILGVATRLSCAVAAVLGIYWIGMAYSFGKPHHDCVALAFALASLPFAPVGRRLALDAWWRRRRTGTRPPERAPWAAMPLRLTQLTLAIGYFFAGASKLAIGGLEWVNGYTLQGILLEFDAPWSWLLRDSRTACALGSAGVVLVQITFPIVLVLPRLVRVYIPASVLFHLIAWKTIETSPFLTLWLLLCCFVPLERVPTWLRVGSLERRAGRGLALFAAALLVGRLYFGLLPSGSLLVAAAVVAVLILAERGAVGEV